MIDYLASPTALFSLFSGAVTLVVFLDLYGVRSRVVARYENHVTRVREGLKAKHDQYKEWGEEASDDEDDEEDEHATTYPMTATPHRWYAKGLKRLQKLWRRQKDFFTDDTWWTLLFEMRQLDLAAFALAAVCSLSSSFVTAFVVRLEGGVLDIARPQIEAIISTSAAEERSKLQSDFLKSIWITLLQIMMLNALQLLLEAAISALMIHARGQRMATLKRRYYRMLLIQDSAFYKKHQTSDVIDWAASDVDSLSTALFDWPVDLLKAASDALSGAAMLVWMDWKTAGLCLLLKAFEYLGVTQMLNRQIDAYFWVRRLEEKSICQAMSASLTEVQSVQMAAAEEFEVRRVEKHAAQKLVIEAESKIPELVLKVVSVFLDLVGNLGLIFVCLYACGRGTLTLGQYTTFQRFFQRMSAGIRSCSRRLVRIKAKLPDIKRYFSYRHRIGPGQQRGGHSSVRLDEDLSKLPSAAPARLPRLLQQNSSSLSEDYGALPDFSVVDDAPPPPASTLPAERLYCKVFVRGVAHRKVLEGNIDFNNVYFKYPEADGEEEKAEDHLNDSATASMVLKGVSFSIKAGQKVAFCGASGCGKTTIFRLLTKFFEATSGSIVIDGIDIRDWDARSLRRGMGYVEQKASIFKGRTVLENLLYGFEPDRYPPMEHVHEVCRKACIHDDILRWKGGYQAILRGKGVNPSGGQEQRLMIARAMLRNPALLLLDESTASLDPLAEQAISESIRELMRGRTCVLIAHRLSTVRSADLIVLFKDGKVAEMGTDKSLRAAKGLYWDFVCASEGGDE